jgi:hypothetical protein
MIERTGLSVPGDFLKLVSAVVEIGLATAQTADRRLKTAADAAIRARLMALLFSFCRHAFFSHRVPRSCGSLNRSGGLAFKTLSANDASPQSSLSIDRQIRIEGKAWLLQACAWAMRLRQSG